MDYRKLNQIYQPLDEKARELGRRMNCDVGYFNGHYHKDAAGNYEMEYFPIPVLTVKGLCDIEMGFAQISVTTKLTREQALLYDFTRLADRPFEAYGVENYLEDFYTAGDTIEAMLDKLKSSREAHIFFSFLFPPEADAGELEAWVRFLEKDGFFY